MHAAQEWKRVTRFNQLTAGDTVRFITRPHIQGTFSWEGHGLAVIRVERGGAPRDFLARLKEIEVLSTPTRKAKEATNV